MKTSQRGLDLIKQFEGFRSEAYRDVVGVLTIGYGFTSNVREGDTMTKAQANARLARELSGYELAVKVATDGQCNQNQFDALVSFCWNVGIEGMQRSSVIKAHRRGDYQAAARAFGLWNKAGGKVWPGLTRRRAAEAALYLEPEEQEAPQDMPQTVEPESSLARSPIVTVTTGTATIGVAAEAARGVKDIRDSLGDWLPVVIVVALIGAAGYVVWQRVRQRRGGWA
mgnify:CR=1 FL=1